MSRLTALQNVEMPLLYARDGWRGRGRRARTALQRVGLGERTKHRPSQMSGGEKQRVAIARALINQPSLLLADEPTGNLDSRTSAEIMALFEQLHQEGQTIIMVTHEVDIAQHARRVIRFSDGKILTDQPVNAFTASLRQEMG